MKKGPKGSFFAHDELENHTTKKKEVKGEKERARRKKGREEKKKWVALFLFKTDGYFE